MRLFGKSIKTQLIVLLFGLTAVAIVVVGFLGVRGVMSSGGKAQQITSSSTQERVEEFLVQNVGATAAKNTTIFKNLQLATSDVATFTTNIFNNASAFNGNDWSFNQNVKRRPNGAWGNGSTGEASIFINKNRSITNNIRRNMELTSYMDYVVPQVLKSQPNAVAMYFVGPESEARYYPNIGLADVEGIAEYDPTTDVFFQSVTPKNDPDKKVVWSQVYNDPAGNGLLITASSPIYTKKNGFYGIIGTDVTLGEIAKNIEDYSPISGSYSFLIDDQGRAVAFPAQAYKDILGRSAKAGEFGPELKGAKGEFATILAQMKQGKQGFSSAQASGGAVYVSYSPIADTPFSLAIVAKQDVVLQVVNKLRDQVQQSGREVLYYQIVPFAAVILVGVWILGFLYIRVLTKPIIELTEKTNKLMEGDFTQKITVNSSNEVGTLGQAFNQMTKELSQSYRALEDKVSERTAELDQKVQELGEAKAKDDAILASIGEGMIVADSQGGILLMNEQAAQFLGVPDLEKVIGTQATDYALFDENGAPIPEAQHPIKQALQQRERITRTIHLKSHKKQPRVLFVTATPVVENERTIGAIQIMHDVTVEKEIDRMKTEFISLASHQLRTPLSAIKWFSEMLLNGDAGELEESHREYVGEIAASTERMIELVNSLLNISRIESGRIMIDPQPTDMHALLEGIQKDLKAQIERREQHVTVEVDPSLDNVKLDKRLISQVYMNLLTNAIKYTPKGGQISLKVKVDGDTIVSEVADNGYGIPAAEQGKMFQKFFRAENVAKVETDGTGLGMYLVKAIVEAGGGKIWFESEEGKGTTFWFSFPRAGMKAKKGEVTIEARHN